MGENDKNPGIPSIILNALTFSPKMTTDFEPDALLKRAHQFDPQALAALHDELYPQVYRYVSFRCDDAQVCEDISSEVFLRFLDVLKKNEQTVQSARGWLFGTANHLVMDHYRKVYRRKDETLDNHHYLADHHDTVRETEDNLAAQEVRSAILNLTQDQQHVITLRFSQGLSLDETAQVMGKSINAVKVLQFRALAALRRQMDGVN